MVYLTLGRRRQAQGPRGANGAPPAPEAPPPPTFALTDGHRSIEGTPSANVARRKVAEVDPVAQKSEPETRSKRAWENSATLNQHKLGHNSLAKTELPGMGRLQGSKPKCVCQISCEDLRPLCYGSLVRLQTRSSFCHIKLNLTHLPFSTLFVSLLKILHPAR